MVVRGIRPCGSTGHCRRTHRLSRRVLRYEDSSGRATHVELRLGDGAIMLGNPSPHYQSPKTHREACEAAARWSETPFVVDGVHVYVDDVEAHFERARAAGARILSEVEDLEGHRWMFAEHVRDVPAE